MTEFDLNDFLKPDGTPRSTLAVGSLLESIFIGSDGKVSREFLLSDGTVKLSVYEQNPILTDGKIEWHDKPTLKPCLEDRDKPGKIKKFQYSNGSLVMLRDPKLDIGAYMEYSLPIQENQVVIGSNGENSASVQSVGSDGEDSTSVQSESNT